MAEETITVDEVAAAQLEQAVRRAEAAEARLAEIHQAVVDGFLAEYGTSTLATFKVAIDLAWSVRKILAGSGLAAREAVAEAERERLLAELASRKVAVYSDAAVTKPPGYVGMVPWAALVDLLAGLPTVGFEEVPGGPGDAPEPLGEQAAVTAERERICAALAARKETLTRPGWGLRRPANVDVVPWEAVAEVLGGGGTAAAGDDGALARVRQLAKCWAGLPPETAASQTLRHAGAQLLAITGEREPGR